MRRDDDDSWWAGHSQRGQSHTGFSWSLKFSIRPPVLDLAGEPVDLFKQLQSDGLAAHDVIRSVQTWTYAHAEEVDKVAISYSVRRYSLSILLVSLSEVLVRDMYQHVEAISKLFSPYTPLVHILGPHQKDSSLFASPGTVAIESSYSMRGTVFPER